MGREGIDVCYSAVNEVLVMKFYETLKCAFESRDMYTLCACFTCSLTRRERLEPVGLVLSWHGSAVELRSVCSF